MKRLCFSILLTGIAAGQFLAQNDLDAIRYSRTGLGGTARSLGMAGAYGAVGADLSAASFNPAGLALYRKSDISLSFGLRGNASETSLYGKSLRINDISGVFNNFGLAGAWSSKADPDSRHAIAFSNTQIQNFRQSTRMQAYTNNSSIARDWLNLSREYGLSGLSDSYEGLAYDAYLMDYDTVSQDFFSFVDINRSVKQTRDLVRTGRINDLSFSYAYTHRDKIYVGGSVSFPQLKYESSTIHMEEDDRDSMRVIMNSDGSFTDTYTEPLPKAYTDLLGFNALEYTEYFKTSGGGFNLKLGAIFRVSEALRLGAYVHTPTFFRLTDTYYNEIVSSFDFNRNATEEYRYPQDGGYFTYRVITPGRYGFNMALILGKKAVIAGDYEFVDYRTAKLRSSDRAFFTDENLLIQSKYSASHNLRLGAELNFNPVLLRAGFASYGSPFGDVVSGKFVRNYFTVGGGVRRRSFYADVVYMREMTREDYYLYSSFDAKSVIRNTFGSVNATVGFRF